MASVLLVDDNQDILDSMTEGMEMFGIDVVGQAVNGEEGIKEFEKSNPDVIILDIMMPDYDGFYFLDKIRKSDSKVKIIVVSGDVKEETSEKLEKYELLGRFSKPVKFGEITDLINS